jgi:hypothetical protein
MGPLIQDGKHEGIIFGNKEILYRFEDNLLEGS